MKYRKVSMTHRTFSRQAPFVLSVSVPRQSFLIFLPRRLSKFRINERKYRDDDLVGVLLFLWWCNMLCNYLKSYLKSSKRKSAYWVHIGVGPSRHPCCISLPWLPTINGPSYLSTVRLSGLTPTDPSLVRVFPWILITHRIDKEDNRPMV